MTREEYAKRIAKIYKYALYFKDLKNEYRIKELTNGDICVDDEEHLVHLFEQGVENLRDYPSKHAKRAYDVVKELYMNPKHIEIKDVAEKYDMSISNIYNITNSAWKIVGENLCIKEQENNG